MSITIRIKNILIAIDQLLWTVFTLGGGYPDETISSAMWRYQQKGYKSAAIARAVIDKIFFWDPDHCYMSFLVEENRGHLPPR
jgi:hypothetical protein